MTLDLHTRHLIPSVEEAEANLAAWRRQAGFPCPLGGYPLCSCRLVPYLQVEAASVALDMANAQASDRRRAEADAIRRSVAW